MAQEDPNRLAEWVLLCRRQWPIVKQQIADWVEASRENPSLIWAAPGVRYTTFVLIGVIGVWVLSGLAGAIAPPPPRAARPEATTADYHVICVDPECESHFVINRQFGFGSFPVKCAKCERKTGERAVRCNSQTYKGRWVAPIDEGGASECPRCAGHID